MASKKGLGRGLQALIPEYQGEEPQGVETINIAYIHPNQYQPRKQFNEESLKELAESIKQNGIIQPIIVRKVASGYQIVAGERRWRAAKIAGLSEIPAIVRDFDDLQVMEIALIENLQREDLNPIEEAKAYKALIEQFNLTQEEISKKIGKSRSVIANSIRLLNLDDRVQAMLVKGEITIGHAKVILSLPSKNLQYEAAKKVVTENLNVRETEDLVKNLLRKNGKSSQKGKSNRIDIHIKEIEDNLCSFLGTKVKISQRGKNRGIIQIEYYSDEDLTRIIELIYGKE
ncbi:parB-like partition protein [Thermoanaerobacter mathranii subsp. mathranii str. A3]|jgi:ParB family chromosome partitioning protein|uniref:ParB family chromosome partitioning protein n=3 Tax=Thermoanaerobacter TaxID=1754 RepID=A0ABT9M4N8_9THEO|nr:MULTISPECIES: ParB/RepB/Spo0J family partition protein [Thermoanaerobacter]ADH61937.1 parB-like partition protein [Thermoanaerobacter mathranii subsp. mathranii str. A3]MBT1280147.1 ParB/RepB/Spo0J family partition protein [Thermoanaerobacter sp. CM-CNRG TB177]MDK2815260.1 ParB family transcriptional regulator, chromosome partitioning protein [Thermoanaerobacter sp.]MDP9751040.1 ParB family chromosome partitioning protein [Thermoanaerobacter pentosaceus]